MLCFFNIDIDPVTDSVIHPLYKSSLWNYTKTGVTESTFNIQEFAYQNQSSVYRSPNYLA